MRRLGGRGALRMLSMRGGLRVSQANSQAYTHSRSERDVVYWRSRELSDGAPLESVSTRDIHAVGGGGSEWSLFRTEIDAFVRLETSRSVVGSPSSG